MNDPSFNPYSLVNTFIDKQSIQLVSVLGVGAYGVVFLGVDVPSSRRYAIKMIIRHASSDNEVELHQRVNGHPGVLRLERVVREEQGRVFLVLEYAAGGDLFAAITQQQAILGNDAAIRSIFLQLVDAVQHCHEQGVAHRDIKPENILVFPKLRVKLADFGLATTQLVSAGFGCGSSFYFSPECQGHTRKKGYSTRQNDIWSLGVILVNMTVGRNPWRQATLTDPTFQQYVERPRPSFFKATFPSISDDLAALLVRIFCLDPARRISLPELRIRIAGIPSFTRSAATNSKTPISASTSVKNKPHTRRKKRHTRLPASTELGLSRSLMCSLCDYVDGWSDNADRREADVLAEKIVSTRRVRTAKPISAHSPCTPPSGTVCSSNSSLEYDPPTPQARPADPYKMDTIADYFSQRLHHHVIHS